jgi:hypothetical protein
MSRNFWTPEQDALLRELVAAGASRRDIAGKIGVTNHSVAGRMKRLGLQLCPIAAAARYREALARRDFSSFKSRKRGKQSPEAQAKRSATLKALYADPVYRAAQLERIAAMNAKKDVAAAAAKASATKMRWCPEHLRDDARMMIRKSMRSGPTREAISEIFAGQLRRALRQIAAIAAEQQRLAQQAKARSRTDFAAIMARVASGQSTLTERRPHVSRDHEFSLTGSTLA